MQTKKLTAVDVFCVNHSIDISFISSLQETGLIDIIIINKINYISTDQLQHLEKIIRFYYELDINIEGIESINHLLQSINSLHDEIRMLKNKLRFYEIHESVRL